MRMMRPEAHYLTDPKKVRSQRASKTSWMSSLLATLLVAVILVGMVGLNLSLAFAAEDEDGFDSEPLSTAFEGSDPDKLNDYMLEYEKGLRAGTVDTNSFQYVLGRLMNPSYLNYLPKAVVASNANDQAAVAGFAPNGGTDSNNYLCSTNQQGAGTPIYHNCDVPNFSAEFVQNLYSLFDRSGPQNAFALNAASILFPQFGQSKAIPGGSVPPVTTGAPNKYTGLEVFGYDLQLSSYFGEWDQIQTMNQARLLTNFSFFDSVNLTAQSIGNAIGGAFDRAGSMAAEGWNTAGIFGAIGGLWSGLFEGGASGAINTMLDTSEANTVLTFGWFRANYAKTSYGLRELSNQEIVAQIRAGFLSYMNATMPEDMSYDQWLKNTDPGGAIMATPPEPPIANCTVYTTPGGGAVVHGTAADAPPGLTADACDQLQRDADVAYFDSLFVGSWASGESYSAGKIVYNGGIYYTVRAYVASSTSSPGSDGANFSAMGSGTINSTGGATRYVLGTPDGGDGRGGWDKDGARPAQSFNQWLEATKAKAGDWDARIGEFGINLSGGSCAPGNADVQEEAAARAAYASWLSGCWAGQWAEAAERDEIKKQTEMNTTWLGSLLTESVLAKWSADNPSAFDFNSPWKRFVCLNPNGTDVTNGTWGDSLGGGDKGTPVLVSAFSASGSVNSLCPQKEYRQPIQGGLFGDGYSRGFDNQNPGVDTRHISNYFGPAIAGVYPFVLQPLNNFTQIFFAIGQFATQVSNEIITWTYMPILDSLGIHDLVEELIKALRDGIFFPMASLIVAAAGLYILYQAGMKKRYREMFISVFYLFFIFIVGAALMFRPGDVITLVDRAPANVEKAVMSLILSPSVSDDKICSTNSSAGTASGRTDWDNLDLMATEPSSDINDIFSKNYNVADDALREVLCSNWKAFVYYPWVFAQWGTSPANLNATAMDNTNSSLVGNAAVDLGGPNGVTNNWAVYQLSSMKIGSTTTIDWNLLGVNIKGKDFYRLVDLQAGPNDGAGTDSRYLDSWTGLNPFPRLVTGVMSAGAAVLGAVTVAAYSVTKVIITFTSVVLLFFLPIVFLFGLFPTKRKFVKDYLMTILSLMIQRVALMLMIALMLVVLIGLISAANNYISVFMGALIVCIAFLKFRKPIVKFAMSSGGAGSSTFGKMASGVNNWATGSMGLDGAQDAKSAWRKTGQAVGQFTPLSVKNYGNRLNQGLRQGAVGAVAGAALGMNPFTTADDWAGRKDNLIQRKQRRSGWGALESLAKTREQIEGTLMREAKADKELQGTIKELQSELPEMEEYFDALDQYKIDVRDFNKELSSGEIIKESVLDAYGNKQFSTEDGSEIIRYYRLEKIRDEATGETIIVQKDVERPIEPERPELVDRDLSIEEIGTVREYGRLSKERVSTVERVESLREKLYAARGSHELIKDLGTNPTESDVARIIEEAFPDSAGYTSVSRAQVGIILKEIVKGDKRIEAIESKMDKLSEDFVKNNSGRAYNSDPSAAQALVVDSVESSEGERR